MTRLRDRAVFVTLAPLALASAALGVRELTRGPFREPTVPGRATEFVPPLLFLAASAAPGIDQSLQVLADRSSARVATAGGDSARSEQGLRVRGSLRILADESLADVELDLVPRAEAQASGWPRDVALHLRAVGARSHTTGAPGVRACSLRCSVVLGGASREAVLAVTWLRLPGGAVELQAVATLDRAPFDLPEPWLARMLPREEEYVLGIDLVLRADG
jgi:hypothetical protein